MSGQLHTSVPRKVPLDKQAHSPVDVILTVEIKVQDRIAVLKPAVIYNCFDPNIQQF
jgi:hypothetical protein